MDIRDFFKNDRYAELTGVELIEVKPGYCRCKLDICDKLYNAANMVQGGAIFTLADFAFAVASNSRKNLSLAISSNITFIKSAKSGSLYAEAIEIADPTKLGHYSVKVTDDNGDIIAMYTSIAYRKKETLDLDI